MQILPPVTTSRSGYALITVLFSLAIITILLTSASRLNVNHARVVSDQVVLSNRLVKAETLLHLAIAERRLQEATASVIFDFNGTTYTAEFRDVGGLVDLNTASPGLLNLLLTNLGAENPSDIIAQFSAWRRSGYQLQRSSDFARVVDLPEAMGVKLDPFITVKSGRRGIDPITAPPKLLEILTDETGTADYLATLLPFPLRSPASGVNFRVEIYNDADALGARMTVHIPTESQTKILAFEM